MICFLESHSACHVDQVVSKLDSSKSLWSHRHPKLMLRVRNVNLLYRKRVGFALQATDETLYEKVFMRNKILRSANAKYRNILLFVL